MATDTIEARVTGNRIVRAWFDTVINPLIAELESEARVIVQRDLTWRFRPGGFEFIRTVRRHLDSRFQPNLDQFSTVYPDLTKLFFRHDELVATLQSAAQNVQALMGINPEFRGLLREAISAATLAALDIDTPADVFGAYPEEDWIKLLAQYVINVSGELPAHYSTAKLWNARRHEFLSVLQHAEIKSPYQSLLAGADELMRTDEAILVRLKDLRLELSLKHDEPYVSLESLSPGHSDRL